MRSAVYNVHLSHLLSSLWLKKRIKQGPPRDDQEVHHGKGYVCVGICVLNVFTVLSPAPLLILNIIACSLLQYDDADLSLYH